MIGTILLCVLGTILVLFLIALRIPAFVQVSYKQGELRGSMIYAWLTIPLFPKSEKESPIATEPPTESAQNGKAEIKSNKINREQILYTIDALVPVFLKALKRFGRHLRIEPLKVHILVASPDPADTAILYGRIQAALAAALPSLHDCVKIREQDIRLFVDFCEEDMDFIVDAGIGIPPGDVLNIAFGALGGIVKWFVGFRKRATKEPGAKDHRYNGQGGESRVTVP